MRAVFFHDAPIIRSKDGEYYSEGFTYEIWKRYLKVFDKLTISTRVKKSKKNGEYLSRKMEISSGPNVFFEPVKVYGEIGIGKETSNNIKDTLKKCDYAIIRMPSFIGIKACKEAKKMRIPYIIELVGCGWDALKYHSFKGKIIAPYMYLKTKKCIQEAHHVIYVTEKFLQERYPTKGKSINCSNVFLDVFKEDILEKRLLNIEEKLNTDKNIIGTVGAVNVRYKGQQHVIKALSILKNKGITNYEYQIVGGGDQDFLQNMVLKYNVTEQVKFLGKLSRENVFEWLDSIDIYAQPSETEGLPRALIEAMSRGLPSIGSDTGGIPELIEKEYTFKNKKNNKEENICNILTNFDKQLMIKSAKRNFNEAKKYDKELIDIKRTSFLKLFKQEND